MSIRTRSSGNVSDVVIATIVAGGIYLLLLVFAAIYKSGALFSMSLLSGVAGAALGWVIGIGLSPYEKSERESFASVGKLIGGFLGGYGVSKLDPALSSLAISSSDLSADLVKKGLVLATIALTSVLTAAALTYITRRYWDDAPDATLKRRRVETEEPTE